MRTHRQGSESEDAVDYYKLLEVSKDASQMEIKKSYRRLALKYHPDKNPDNLDKAEKKFKLIAEAYEVLSDESRRKMYDQYGKSGVNRDDDSPTYRPSHYSGFQHKSHDPRDIFNQVFGDSSPFMNFWNSQFHKTSSHSRPRSFHENLFSTLDDDFDILFSTPSSRSTCYANWALLRK
ncbi:DNAJB2 [Bugula neritina]|uniref:DNAJB2 n=1 Tax=Bugula neritina TaxID=10212 RepID=A0A7J7JJE3_BUGNE|nr:DNAJB2 [Bugula neritina]